MVHIRNCSGRFSLLCLWCPSNFWADLERIPNTCSECQSRTCHTESKPCWRSFVPDRLICSYQLKSCRHKKVHLHIHQTLFNHRLQDLPGSEWVLYLGRTFFYIRKLQFVLASVVGPSLGGPRSTQSFRAHSVLCLCHSQHAKSCLGSKACRFHV